MLCLQFDYDIDNTSPNLDSVRFGKGSVFDINFCSRFAPWFHNKGPNTWRNFFKNIKCFFHYSPRHNLATFIDCHSLLQDSRLLAICTLMVSTYLDIISWHFLCKISKYNKKKYVGKFTSRHKWRFCIYQAPNYNGTFTWKKCYC